jgi:disulfide bond formation protein DsbB
MVIIIQSSIPFLVLVSHLFLVCLVISAIFPSLSLKWVKKVLDFIGHRSLHLSFTVSLVALLGSLFYSQVVGFEPCVLCWWQRIFIYPMPIILAVAIWKRDYAVFRYIVPLALVGVLVSGYHAFTNLGGTSLLPCTALGEACSRLYVLAFGYITIPMMSLTICLYILFIVWMRGRFNKSDRENENRHS